MVGLYILLLDKPMLYRYPYCFHEQSAYRILLRKYCVLNRLYFILKKKPGSF